MGFLYHVGEGSKAARRSSSKSRLFVLLGIATNLPFMSSNSNVPTPSLRRVRVFKRPIRFSGILNLGFLTTFKSARHWAVVVCSNCRLGNTISNISQDWRGSRCSQVRAQQGEENAELVHLSEGNRRRQGLYSPFWGNGGIHNIVR